MISLLAQILSRFFRKDKISNKERHPEAMKLNEEKNCSTTGCARKK